ncbi:hypothetical protein SAMN04487906_0456 [Zhouia amylolytica]|uniref:Uncharacterized protein n=2 Tax=Zhouia amylolytica TaxID=376730 RepID=W2UIQ1_9FLAO|nr:hypothetical protein P278_28540 [Zhouia amylolytica AD3]SFS43236.1 hypothetical protein SAMN04487906_0456 [Zhouia amylolytica]
MLITVEFGIDKKETNPKNFSCTIQLKNHYSIIIVFTKFLIPFLSISY